MKGRFFRLGSRPTSAMRALFWAIAVCGAIAIILSISRASGITSTTMPSNLSTIYYVLFLKSKKNFMYCFICKLLFNLIIFGLIILMKKAKPCMPLVIMLIAYYIYIVCFGLFCLAFLYGLLSVLLLLLSGIIFLLLTAFCYSASYLGCEYFCFYIAGRHHRFRGLPFWLIAITVVTFLDCALMALIKNIVVIYIV